MSLSLVYVPGLVVKPTLNCLALVIPETVYNLLYEVDAAPVVFSLLLTLYTWTLDPIVKLWGSSVLNVTVAVPSQDAFSIILKFLCWFTLAKEPDPK